MNFKWFRDFTFVRLLPGWGVGLWLSVAVVIGASSSFGDDWKPSQNLVMSGSGGSAQYSDMAAGGYFEAGPALIGSVETSEIIEDPSHWHASPASMVMSHPHEACVVREPHELFGSVESPDCEDHAACGPPHSSLLPRVWSPQGPVRYYNEWPPWWYVSADALWWGRNKPSYKNLSVLDESDDILLNTQDLNFDFESGMRLNLGRYVTDSTSLELTTIQINNWDATKGTEFLESGGIDPYWGDDVEALDLSTFASAEQHVASYGSQVRNWEFGLRHVLGPNAAVSWGLSYWSVDETFDLVSIDGSSTARYSIDADNDLFGLYVGGAVTRMQPVGWLTVALNAKAGLYGNAADHSSELFDVSGSRNQRSASGGNLASSLELGLTANIHITGCLYLRGGYQLVYLGGLAAAPDQLDLAPNRNDSRDFLSSNGSMFMHGPFVGVELSAY